MGTALTPITRRERGVWALLLVLSVVWLVLGHFTVTKYGRYANVDEGYASAIAERLLEGERLYQGAVSQRGPLMYYTYELLALLFGWDNVTALRVTSALAELVTVGLVFEVGRAFELRVGIAAAAITSYFFVLGLMPYDGLALNGEVLLLPWLVLGALLTIQAMRRGQPPAARRALLLGAGLAMGAAVSVKQSAALQPLAALVWIGAVHVSARSHLRAAAGDLALFGLGVALLPTGFVVHAWRDGSLGALVYYCFTYNARIHIHPFAGSGPLDVLGHVGEFPVFSAALVLAVATSAPVVVRRVRRAARARRGRLLFAHAGLAEFLWLEALFGLAIALKLPQLFHHYFLIPFPFLAVIFGKSLVVLADRAPYGRSAAPVLVGLGILETIAAYSLLPAREKTDGRVNHGVALDRAAAYVNAHSQEQDKVFVWGFSPWIYGYAHRRPAGRFVFATYATGFIPWFWSSLPDEPARVVPGAMDALLGDLLREDPALVVDAGNVQIARPLRAYAPLAKWLRERYCFDARIGAFDVYSRMPKGGCANRCAPVPAPPVDYFDVPLFVPVPPIVDAAEPGRGWVLPSEPFLEPRRITDPSCSRD